MRVPGRFLIAIAPIAVAAQVVAQQPAPRPLTAEAQAAFDMLGPQVSADVEVVNGWYRDRPVSYYAFGVSAQPAVVGRVLWPIHGFDMQGNPVAIRGQRPIFSTIPGLADYNGLWRLTYLVTADNVQPNVVRDFAAAEAVVRRRRAHLQETNLTFNLPITPMGARLAADSMAPMLGWYEGRDVQFFDFGQAASATVPMLAFVRGRGAAGEPDPVGGSLTVIDSVPLAPPYADLWEMRHVHVDSAFTANSLRAMSAVSASGFLVEPTRSVRNAPIITVDGTRLPRTPSPLTTFADLRAPFPPTPTVLRTP